MNPPKQVEVVKLNSVNRKRYCNALFCDEIRQRLATRSEPLLKDELTDGLNSDETLHQEIVKQYNNIDLHNGDAFPDVIGEANPTIFTGLIVWSQWVKTLKEMT